MDNKLYSVRMRASHGGRHISGAERIVLASQVPEVSAELVARAMCAVREAPDDLHCFAEQVDPDCVQYRKLPDVTTWQVPDWQVGRKAAGNLLVQAGVPRDVVVEAIRLLAEGPAPGRQVMRGALILDVLTGQRLEADPQRGVRVSRMDLAPAASEQIRAQLAAGGLTHHRVSEALVLSGKVLGAPGLVAELCWSDDPEYLTGYVADPVHGYQRITQLKPSGENLGGRVFFVATEGWDCGQFTNYLEQQVMLFNALGTIHPPETWES